MNSKQLNWICRFDKQYRINTIRVDILVLLLFDLYFLKLIKHSQFVLVIHRRIEREKQSEKKLDFDRKIYFYSHQRKLNSTYKI